MSKAFNQAFFDNLKCANAQELQEELNDMRSEPEPCKNTAKVIYNPDKGMQRAIMCAIMSVDQKVHVYVNTEDLETLLDSESVKCFDKNYKLKLTLLYPKDRPPRPKLRCDGGFYRRKGGWARNGRLRDQKGVQVVRFTGNARVAEKAFAFTIQRRTMALRTWISTLDCQEVRDEAAPASAWRAFLRALAQSRSTFDFGMDHF